MNNRVGLGTFPLASVFHPISPPDVEKCIQSFIELGGYYIDTAPLYGNGFVESELGRALHSISRDRYYLITKTVKHVDESGRLFKSGRYKDVIEQIDNSLRRLQTEYIDLLMVHSPDNTVPIEETLGAMEKLQEMGKVRELAVSNVNLDELKAYNKTGKMRYIQNRFSLINRSLSSEFQSYLIKNNIHLIPYHLLEIGMLTGIAFEKYTVHPGDLREKLPYWNQENQDVIFAWVRESLAPIAKECGTTIGQLNIAWALSQTYIHFVIVGVTNPEYLPINLKANDIHLPPEIVDRIEQTYLDLEDMVHKNYKKTMREFRGLNEKYY